MTYPMHLTDDELERWAYMNNDGLTARLAGEVADQVAQIELLEEELESK